jgi:surface antigen
MVVTKIKNTLKISAAVALGLAPTSLASFRTFAVDPYDEKIKAVEIQISANQAKIAELKAQTDTLENKISQIQLEVDQLQSQLSANELKNNQLLDSIKAEEANLKIQKDLLGKQLKAIYIEGQTSTLEMLASSNSISDFLDKREARIRLKEKISGLVTEVENSKEKLEKEQTEVANLIEDQKLMTIQLDTKKSEVADILNRTKGEEANYQAEIVAQKAEKSRLQTEQAAATAASLAPKRGGISYISSSGVRNGGYPDYWNNLPLDALVDNWGMYTRECVSYTAFKVWQSGRYMPYWGGVGNANQWPGNARRAGIPVDRAPQVGDVAVSMEGYYGHVMYVERVNSDGTIYVSQYNYGWSGEYSEMTISSANLWFIHF